VPDRMVAEGMAAEEMAGKEWLRARMAEVGMAAEEMDDGFNLMATEYVTVLIAEIALRTQIHDSHDSKAHP
jgi:hypothetical protein